MVTDQISDFITRIKNGSLAGKPSVAVINSKFVFNVAQALKKAGYIERVENKGKEAGSQIEIVLRYLDGGARIRGAERVSLPSKRVYARSTDLRTYRSGFGNFFLSTPKGVMTEAEARKNKVGGEVLFKIW